MQHLREPVSPMPEETPQRSFLFELHQVFSNLFSKDPPTRKMALFFSLNLLGLIVVGGMEFKRRWVIHRQQKIQQSRKDALRLQEWARKIQPNQDVRTQTTNLGSFLVSLAPSTQRADEQKLLQLAEIEIVLLCQNAETRSWIENHLAQTRDLLLQSRPTINREELLSRDGKQKFKRTILEGLNRKLPAGYHVEELFFSKLILN